MKPIDNNTIKALCHIVGAFVVRAWRDRNGRLVPAPTDMKVLSILLDRLIKTDTDLMAKEKSDPPFFFCHPMTHAELLRKIRERLGESE